MHTQPKYNQVLKKWQSLKKETPQDIDMALSNFRILFAYHSNAIENPETTYHDTREIFENGQVINFTGNLRTLYEIENQKITHEELRDTIAKGEDLSPALIKRMHKLLMRRCYDEARYAKGERPGEYKKHDYITGDNIGALPEEVPDEISDLCDELENYSGDILTAAAYLHLSFESIHPFADGNGRVGRTLMNYFLMIHDYPPTIIYNEDKDTYYLALAAFDKTGRIDGFIQFIKEQTIKTWDRQPIKRKALGSYTQKKTDMFRKENRYSSIL